jgi:hypothetical protein
MKRRAYNWARSAQIESSDGCIAANTRYHLHAQDALNLVASTPDTTTPTPASTIAVNGARPASAALCLLLSIHKFR